MERIKRSSWMLMALLAGCSGKLNVGQSPSNHEVGGAAGNAQGSSAHAGDGSGGDESKGDAGDGDARAGSGGAPDSLQGTLGGACIPSATVDEAVGTAAHAVVTLLEHCEPGLTCSANGVCEGAPDCKTASGECALYHPAHPFQPPVDYDGAGGVGGGGNRPGVAGGSGMVGAPNVAGAANAMGGRGGAGPNDKLYSRGVRSLVADDSHLYWLDLGTLDSLNTSQNDAALLAYSFKDGKTKVLASGLVDPTALAVASQHAYVLLGRVESQVVRLSLEDGTPEPIPGGAVTYSGATAAIADTLYWLNDSQWFKATGDGAATPIWDTPIPYEPYSPFGADDAALYFALADGGIGRLSVANGEMTNLITGQYWFAVPDQDFVYAFEPVLVKPDPVTSSLAGLVLGRVPKAGGTWQRVRALGGWYPHNLQIVGDRYYVSMTERSGGGTAIESGLLSASTPPLRFPKLNCTEASFVATPTTVYWTDCQSIYQRKVSDLP